MRSHNALSIMLMLFFVTGIFWSASAQTLPPDRPGLERGQGGWMEILPETYGYFGPDIVLAHRDTLGLGPAQLRTIYELYDRMHTSVLEKGKLILAAEEDLEDMFASGKLTTDSAAKQAVLIGKLRGELRALYLGADVAMHDILNDRQRGILSGLVKAAPLPPPEIR